MTSRNANKISNGKAFPARSNWLSSLNWQIDFYQKSNRKRRADSEFDWHWFEHFPRGIKGSSKRLLIKTFQLLHLPLSGGVNQKWVNKNAAFLWEARDLLSDELSKLLFDSMLVLRCTDYSQFYFPRIDFDDFVSLGNDKPFSLAGFPVDYLGLPLREFNLEIRHKQQLMPLTLVSTSAQIVLLNSYRQYFVKRDSIDFTPCSGEVVLDCGACIGEVSTLIAVLVGACGQIHLFDPVPMHARFCQLQASLNPLISHVYNINAMAVSDRSHDAKVQGNESGFISPGNISTDAYPMITLDDYVANNNLSRVNMIKMDIEGAEMAALDGASCVIRELKPRLAISAYHKPEDIWEIPQKLRALNGDYKLFFGHHSPVQWESVYYAA